MSPARKAARVGKRASKRTTKRTTTRTTKRATKRATTRVSTRATTPAVSGPPVSAPPTARAAAKAEKRDRNRRRRAHLAERFGHTDPIALERAMRAVLAEEAGRVAAPPARGARPRKGARVMAQAVSDRNRWVPIGPSVVRRGQADGRPRVSGRVRDLQVDATGQRAYAAAGNGGVWYTEDAGITWRPIGGWASSPGRAGGVSTDMSCGCLLVSFGATAADDLCWWAPVRSGRSISCRLARRCSRW